MNKQKILIIEDEIINAMNIKNTLEKRGYDVCDIGISTKEAITLTEKHNPDLILMDIILDGDKDGIDAIIEIKKKHDIPFIYCTANTNEQTLKKAKKTEPYGYIIKPINRKELESTVEIALYKFKMDKKLKESEEKFKSLAEKSLAGVYIIQDGLLKYVNPRHAEIFGYTAEEMIGIIDPLDRVYHEDRQFVEKNVMKREKGNEKFGNYTFRGVTKKGNIIHVEIFGSRTMYEGKPAVIGTLLDITGQKQAEEKINRMNIELTAANEELYTALKELENANKELLQTNKDFKSQNEELTVTQKKLELSDNIVNNIQLGLYIYRLEDIKNDKSLRMVFANQATADLTGVPVNEVVGKTLDENFPGLREDESARIYAEVIRSGKPKTLDDIYYGDSSISISAFSVKAFPLPDNHVGVSFEDITGQKQTQESLAKSEAMFKGITEKSLVGVYLIQKGVFKYVNQRYTEIYGYSDFELKNEIVPKDIVHPDDWHIVEENMPKKKNNKVNSTNYTFRGITKKGNIIHLEVYGSRTSYEGKPAIIGTMLDITERKKVEKLIETSLREKKTLLKEIHHRVNNNMNIITSIIELKKMDINTSNAVQFLEDIQTRIMTISLIHEKLYKSKDIKYIDIAESITSLSNDILNIYNPYPKKIKLNVDAEHTLLTIDQAIPLGLLLNEVLTNAFKYAFPEGRTGPYEINISLKKKNDQTVTLTIKDNGIGLPDNFDVKNIDSLGLSLVDSLTKQLKGVYKISGRNGTKVAITFPEELKKVSL